MNFVLTDRADQNRTTYDFVKLSRALWRTARPVHPAPTFSDAFARAKYFIRGAARPGLTAEWFAILGSPGLERLVEWHPHAFSKLQRPYLHRRLDAAGRLAALRSHYRFVAEYLDEQVRAGIFTPQGYLLAALPETRAGRFALRLFYARAFSKEGDLSLSLVDEERERPMVTLTFCVSDFDAGGPREIFIGGLQGHAEDGLRELLVELTRSMHGLRPKALLVCATQRLAQTWGIPAIKAVSGREHIYRHYLKRRHFDADYDEFWTQSNGQRLADGTFLLPAIPLARNVDELPRNKRGMYRQRYAMLARLGEQIAARAVGWDEPVLEVATLPEEFEGMSVRLHQSDEVWMLNEE